MRLGTDRRAQRCSHLLGTNPLSLCWPQKPQTAQAFERLYLLFPGIRLSLSALSKVPLSQLLPGEHPGLASPGPVAAFPACLGGEPEFPLAPSAAVSQLENPLGEQSKSHTLLTAAPGRGQKRKEGIPSFAINCMQIGSLPGTEQGASASFMS